MAATELAKLNTSLFELVESFPRATWELADYHFKSTYDEYLNALRSSPERRVAVFANDVQSLEKLCRRLLIIADTVVFNVATYLETPTISIFPIPDSVASPVLGIAPVLDSSGGEYRAPKPVEVVHMLTMTAAIAESRGPDTVLGYEWGRESNGWQRSHFTRTSPE